MNYKRFLFNKVSQVFIDIFIFVFAFFLAYSIRLESFIQSGFTRQFLLLFPLIALARLISFYFFSVYSIVWKYISLIDVLSIIKACIPLTVLLTLGRIFSIEKLSLLSLPYSVIALEFLLAMFGTLGVRMARRLLGELSERESFESGREGRKKRRVLLIGAGAAGNMVVKELKQRADLGYDIIGFIDDEPQKYKNVIQGYRVLGPTSRISEIARKYGVEEAIITIANASSKDIRKIVNLCEEIPLKVKIVPGLFEMLDDKIKVSKIREVDIADLLGRSVVRFENQAAEVISQYRDKRIMITGAGGSIGSELCRQLAAMSPRELILVDKDENSIYEIDQELNDGLAAFKIRPVISNIKNFSRTRWIFEQCRPEVVFHAAAHKHVPLMEYNAAEAILNNVLGTKNVAELADQYQVESFISISTDKAINPTNIMGATKKIGELIVQNIASRSRTRFSCVRFGNVLGSRGSVIPLFQRQIAKGGPITITHPEIRRYFMSIGEAVQLIIQAGSIGQKGEIFVLDMGEPIHILDLAKDLIKLSGYREDDFEIKFIGLRPGEKLFEEMLVDEERAKSTQFKKIFIAPPVEVENPDFSKMLTKLMEAANGNDEPEIINILSALGIGYRRPAAS